MVTKMLEWRDANNVDEIRKNIVEGGIDCIQKFPKAEIILPQTPCLVFNKDLRDKAVRLS